MGLILPQKVKIDVSGNIASYYEKLGYEIPRYYNKRRNSMAVVAGTRIEVDVNDLKPNSNLIIDCECDICKRKESITKMEYTRISSYVKKYNYDYLCLDCKFDVMPTAKLNVGTFKNDEEEIKKFLIRKLTRYIENYGYPKFKKRAFRPENKMPTLRMYEMHLKGDLVDWIQECGYKLSDDEIYEMRHRGGQSNGYSKADAVQIILEMSNKLDRPLMYCDFKNPHEGTIGITAINKYWGSLNKMKEELGLEIAQESMMDKQLSKEDFDDMINKIITYAKENDIPFLSTREIRLHKEWSSYTALQKYSKRYYNEDITSHISKYGVTFGEQGRGLNYDFEDGEHTTSQYEYLFSKYLKEIGLKYNVDYFRDVKYSKIDNAYKGNMNCDYVINYNGRTIYIEIAGVIADYKNWYYADKPILKSKSKEKYRLKLQKKEKLFKQNNCIYFLLFPCDLTRDNFMSILNNPTDELRVAIEKFMVNNIDWQVVRKIGELDYSKDIIRNTRPKKLA